MARVINEKNRIVIKVNYSEWTLENGFIFDLYIGKGLSESKLWNLIFSCSKPSRNDQNKIIGEEQMCVKTLIFLDKDGCYYMIFSGNSAITMKYNPNTGMINMHHDFIGD